MVEVLIAAASAIVGGVVATVLTARGHERHWRAEQRFAAYVEFVNGGRLLLFRGADIGKSDPSDPHREQGLLLAEQKEIMREAMRLFRNATSRTVMLGPIPLANEANDVLHYFEEELYVFFMAIGGPTDESPPEVVEARARLQRFHIAAASELAIFRQSP